MNGLLSCCAYLGGVWIVLLFGFCFFIVHIARLACLGRQAQKRMLADNQKDDAPPSVEKKPTTTSGEPIYYIVEKKRRAKSAFSAPKEFRFK